MIRRQQQPSKLYDRSHEQCLLEQAYANQAFCLISGATGTGKTALALSLKEKVQQDGGYFLHGMFNQSQMRSPYPVMVSAFTDFARQVEERGQLDEMQRRIHDNIQSEASVLGDMIPALKPLVGGQKCSSLSGNKAILRVSFVFHAFLLAIAVPNQPIVLCIDDVQWADQCSMRLLCSLIASTRGKGIFFLATYRDENNDVEHESNLSVALKDLEEKESIQICRISLQNLGPRAVTTMLHDMLNMSAKDTDSLSEYLFRCTHGNLLLLLTLLHRLQDDKIVVENEDNAWCLSGDLFRKEDADLEQLVNQQLTDLAPEDQQVLKLAAFLQVGSIIDVDLLNRISKESVMNSLERCAEKRLLIHSNTSFQWAHDKIEDMAYALVDSNQGPDLHLDIGRKLWRRMEEDELKQNIFVVLNQLMRSIDLIKDQKERNAVASLCLCAGETAIRSSTYRTALVYLDLGLTLLGKGKDQWWDHYDLSIALHNLAAECAFCVGEFGHAENLRQQVFRNGRNLQDMIRLHILYVSDLGTAGKLSEAIKHCVTVLKELGEEFPKKATKLHILREMWICRRKLRPLSNLAVLRLPNMSDNNKLAAMQILNVMMLNVYHVDILWSPLIAVRMMRLSLDYGLSAISSAGFAFFGMVACLCGDTELGYRCGQLALHLLDKFKVAEFIPRTYSAVYGVINGWKCELSASLEPLRFAYCVALETGDLEFAIANASMVGYKLMYTGETLATCEREICSFIESLESRNNGKALPSLCISLKLVRYLLNHHSIQASQSNREPLSVQFSSQMIKRSDDYFLMSLWEKYSSAYLSYILGDFGVAAQEVKKARPLVSSYYSNAESIFVVMLDGLIHLTQGRHRSVKTANRCVRKLRRGTWKLPNLFLSCRYFVEAELASALGNVDKAIMWYTSAASVALELRLHFILGSIYERFGEFYGRLGQEDDSMNQFKKSVDAFRDWGATAKVQQMCKHRPELLC